MNKLVIALIALSSVTFRAEANEAKNAPFTDSEAAFKTVMQKLLTKYADQKVTKDELYRAATAGMLSSLNADNADKEHPWNALLTPEEVDEMMQVERTGKVSGIGAAIFWDKEHGYGDIAHVIAGSPAEKYGLKTGDQILSVNGEKYKGKTLRDMVMKIRGAPGESVNLKVLRDADIVSLNVKRGVVPWARVALQEINDSTALLYIDYFSAEVTKQVEKYLSEVNEKGYKKLIVDVRGTDGGDFDEAMKTIGYFLPKGTVVASTIGRNGEKKDVVSNTSILKPDTEIVVLTNKGTHCAAELLAAALKEIRHARLVGETTSGKWNAQEVEMLPNKYAIKYTVSEFFSPKGNTYENKGLKPDVEVAFVKEGDKDTGTNLSELREKFTLSQRLAADAQLKAAVELIR